MTHSAIVEKTMAFVKKTLAGAEGGHDWFHTHRVYRNAKLISVGEPVDLLVVELAALLHDIADAKFHNGDESIGPKMASEFLNSIAVEEQLRAHVIKIIENVSFKNSLDDLDSKRFRSKELEVVQDADRLDALGAIGIARTFNYGGFKNRPLYDPDIPPKPDQNKEAYKKSKAPTINHFYEKLLLLKDQMNTESGKRIAEGRHEFLLRYLEQFYGEWNGAF